MKRDAKADLEMCERATPGPWSAEETNALSIVAGKVEYTNGKMTCGGFIADIDEDNNENAEADARFLAESREALPHYIKRTLQAEELLKKILPFAKFSSCEYNTDPDAKPIMHCCEWSETVKQIIEFLGTEPCDK